MSNCLTTRVLNLITDTDAKGTKKGNDKLMQMLQKHIFSKHTLNYAAISQKYRTMCSKKCPNK